MENLKSKHPEKCNGCELCVMECQRQFKLVGLEGSVIRILKERDPKEKIKFRPEIDPRVTQLNQEKIKAICPTGVFEISEGTGSELIS